MWLRCMMYENINYIVRLCRKILLIIWGSGNFIIVGYFKFFDSFKLLYFIYINIFVLENRKSYVEIVLFYIF